MAERKWRILYVEDEPEMIDLVQLVLRTLPVEVIGASNANEALQALRAQPPDLVLLDLMIPEVDGWAIHREIQADPRLRHIPIIVITAWGNLEDREKGLHAAGVVDYILKPFSTSDLIASVSRVLRELAGEANGQPNSQAAST